MTEPADREKLRQEMAMRLFLQYGLTTNCLRVEQKLEYDRLVKVEATLQPAWDYLTRMAAENARRDADAFVEAYFR